MKQKKSSPASGSSHARREVTLSSGQGANEVISGEDWEEGVSGPLSLPSGKSRKPDPDTDCTGPSSF